MKDLLEIFFWLIIMGLVMFHAIAGTVWQINNPKANQMTFYTHYNDVIHFKILPQFQE